MGNSLMIACSKMGLHFTACTNKKYFPDESLVEQCKAFAKESGGSVTLTEDVKAGTTGADVIYTDVWVSMASRLQYGRSVSTICFISGNKQLWIMQQRCCIYALSSSIP